MSSLVAFIIGSGPNIGHSVGTLLKEKGYAIAFGSRNPNTEEAKKAGFFPVQVDVSKSDSIKEAFAAVNAELGPPNVVVYNAASFNIPLVPTDPLSLPLEGFNEAASIGLGVFVAAQLALPGFVSEAHKNAPKAFIVTGNALPHHPPSLPLYIGLGIQKTIQARLIDYFSKAYEKEDIRFHFATLVSAEGIIPVLDVFKSSGPTHAQVYWDLISRKEPENWDYRFTADGKKWANYD